MEQIRRRPLSEIAELAVLQANWEQWGREFKKFLDGGKANGVGVNFSWRQNIYSSLRAQLANLTQDHCTFCDEYPVGTESKETIEHFEPKDDFPLKTYQWDNLFYCCDKCQSEANRDRPFQFTLKPDDVAYRFDRYFYFDPQSGKLKVMENLLKEEPTLATLADLFLKRYGINDNPKRCQSRKHNYRNIKNALSDLTDGRIRDDFPYRYVYDCVLRDLQA